MGLFDLFKKKEVYVLPANYAGVITEAEYNLIINISKEYHAEKEIKIIKIGEGEIVAQDTDGEEQHKYLDNLVKVLSANEKQLWKDLIYGHFDKGRINKSAYNYLFKDFEYAAQFLRVLLKSSASAIQDKITDLVCRTDLPNVNTYLVLEFENQFRYFRHQDIIEWERPIDELFEIALENTPLNEIEVKECEFGDKFTVYAIFSGDFAASLVLDLKTHLAFAIGTYGSLVAIPTKGTAFVHPIETGDILQLVEELSEAVYKFHSEDVGSIVTDFYWYYNDKFEIFPTGQTEKGWYIRMPDTLIEIFKPLN